MGSICPKDSEIAGGLAALRPTLEAVAREALAEGRFWGMEPPPEKLDEASGAIVMGAPRDPNAIVAAVLSRPRE